MFLKNNSIKSNIRIEGRIGGEIKRDVNSKGNSYARFSVAPTGKDDLGLWFTVFFYNMHEAEFIFDKCGYGKGDTVIIEGNLNSVIDATDESGRQIKVFEPSITADRVIRGAKKRMASDVAAEHEQTVQPAAAPAPSQSVTQQSVPQQEEIKSFSEIRQNITDDDEIPL